MVRKGERMEHHAVRLRFHVLQNTKERERPWDELQVWAKRHRSSVLASV
jgi:hypothetical protein